MKYQRRDKKVRANFVSFRLDCEEQKLLKEVASAGKMTPNEYARAKLLEHLEGEGTASISPKIEVLESMLREVGIDLANGVEQLLLLQKGVEKESVKRWVDENMAASHWGKDVSLKD